jgi:TonB system transport protein ExbD (group 1)
MAANIGTGETSGGGKKRFSDNNEINVTPFVDVMLVLLIIFMVAAPLATVNIKLDLPPPDATPQPQLIEPVFVSLQDTGQIFIGTTSTGETEANWATFRQVLGEKTGRDYKRKIFVRADQKVAYADVMKMMDEIQDSGYHELALVAEDVVD